MKNNNIVTVFICRTDKLSDEPTAYADLIGPERVSRITGLNIADDRRRSAAVGLLLGHALREVAPEAAGEKGSWNASGKPVVAGRDDLLISLSHSANYAACAITKRAVDEDNAGIGVDIQRIEGGSSHLARRFLPECEYRPIARMYSSDADEYFTRMWTRHESCQKAAGVGMLIPPSSFDTSGKVVALPPAPPFPGGVCAVTTLDAPRGYCLSLALLGDELPEISLQEVDTEKLIK